MSDSTVFLHDFELYFHIIIQSSERVSPRKWLMDRWVKVSVQDWEWGIH